MPAGEKVYLLDMFPYPSGSGLHVGHPLGFIGTDVLGRYLRMTGKHRAAHHGLRRVRPARRAVRRADRHPPAQDHRGEHPAVQGAAAAAGPGARPAPLGRHHRRRVLPLDAVDLPADLQLLVRRRAGPPDRGAGGGVRRRVARDAGRPSVGGADAGRAAPGDRLPPAGLHLRGPRQLVPGPGHGAGERGGHRGRAQRPGQLPRVPPQPEAVDDADHRVRRPAGRRPGPAGLAGFGQGDAAQLDRPLRGRAGPVPRRRHRDRGLHHPPGHPVRRHLHGAGPRAPAGRRHRDARVAVGRRRALDGRRARPRRRRSRRTARRRPASPTWTARRTRTRPASSPAPSRPTRSTAARSRCSSPTTC